MTTQTTPTPTHNTDLVLAPTLTPGRPFWTCPNYNHDTTRTDYVHTHGPCPNTTP